MRFTLSWLRDHLETQAPLAEITAALTDLGLEVEEVADPAARLGAFRVARVIEAGPHPNADRLSLCRVETRPAGPQAPAEEVQVVCGAPNARSGMLGVFAAPGTHVPGTGIDLKAGMIRGVESNGMLLSERELGLSDEHEGIIELSPDAPVGARYIDYAGLDDPVVEIAITPNRPDALGVRGVARDLAARGLGRLKDAPVTSVPGRFAAPVGVRIDADVQAGGCPLFCGRVIRGVVNGPSPDWLQHRLRAIGLRPISALVDITNYLTYDRNRPLHVFDAARLEGDLRVHFAQGGERLTALDDRDYTLEPGMMAISDAAGVESIAGVMGGAATAATEATRDVFVESAYWDPITIAATGRALRIASDARYRFERGVDPTFTADGLELATRLILEICGGDPSEVVTAGAVPDIHRAYRHDPARTESLVGLAIPEEEQRATLTALGFRLEGAMAHVPPWRPDVQGPADLVEEVARVASLSRLPARPMPPVQVGAGATTRSLSQRREGRARRAMAALGYDECVTYSFVGQEAAALFGGGGAGTALDNPISTEMSHMRPDLLPGLLQAAARNQARGRGELALFEVGPVFSGGAPGEQETQVAGLRVGATGPREPHGTRRPVDVFDAKADAEAVLAALGAPESATIRREAPGAWHPGRSACIGLGPKTLLATFGELHPRVLEALDVKGPAVAVTVHPERLPRPRAKSTTRPALAASDLQPVARDFAFVLDARVEAARVVRAARGADKRLIERVDVFDEFSGERAEAAMGAGRKSLAITVRLQPRERTLTEAEIETVGERIVAAVGEATGGRLRG